MPLGDGKHIGGAMLLDGNNRSRQLAGGFRTEDVSGDLLYGAPQDSINTVGSAGNLVSPIQLTAQPTQIWIPYGCESILLLSEGEAVICGGLTPNSPPVAPGTAPAFVAPVNPAVNATPPAGGFFPIPNRNRPNGFEPAMTLDISGMNSFFVRARGVSAQLYILYKMAAMLPVN